MNCGMKDEMLLAWVDGDLDQAGRARVAEHIVGCVDCHRTIGDLREVTGALEKWPAPEPDSLPSARELLDRAGLPPSAAPGSGGWRNFVRRYGAVAGIALFAAVAGLVILPRYAPSDKSGRNAGPVAESTTKPAAPGIPAQTATAPDSAAPGTAATNAPAAPVAPEEQQAGAEKAGTAEGDAGAAAEPVADGEVANQAGDVAAAEAPAPPPAGPGALAQPPAAESAKPATVTPARDDADAGKADSSVASGGAAAAPKSAARSAGRREAGYAVVHRADIAMSGAGTSEIADRVAAAARAERGSVTKRWTRAKDSDSETVTVELSVPAENFERTISRLRGVGNVQSVRRSAIDLSGRIGEINDEIQEERKNEDAPADTRKRKSSKESLERERQKLEDRAGHAIITVTIVRKP